MFYILPIISLFLCFPAKTTSNADEDLAPMIPLLSDELYMSLFPDKNSTLPMDRKGYQPLQKADLVTRRYLPFEWMFNALAFVDTWVPKTTYHHEAATQACWNINGIYRGGLRYIHRYYKIRTLYVNTLEYDIGYLTHQIISRYQMMIEIYHIIIHRFVNVPEVKSMPLQPFFYFYTNMLEQAQTIEELVNMLVHVEQKYVGVTHSLWDDSTPRTRRRRTRRRTLGDNETASTLALKPLITESKVAEMDRAADYERQRLAQLRKRKKELKKRRELMLQNFEKTFKRPTFEWTKKPSGHWELHYGWSIENW